MRYGQGNLWAFDFDGTISPLIADRSRAELDPECKECLIELAASSENVVAVVSSRALDDLEPRVQLENVLLSGSSGLEWRLLDGRYLGPSAHSAEQAARRRVIIGSALEAIRPIAGVEIEEKPWSVAVHFRKTSEQNLSLVLHEVEQLRFQPDISLYYGPAVAEIQLIEEINKVTAVRTLARLFEREFPDPLLVYAGDDQNDVLAMRWVLERKGMVFAVGDRIAVKGACAVPDPGSLARILKSRVLPMLAS